MFMSEHELFKHMNQVCKSFLLELHRGQQERVHNIEIQEANQYIKPLTIPIRQRLSDLIRPDACYQFAVCADFSQDLVYSIYFCRSLLILLSINVPLDTSFNFSYFRINAMINRRVVVILC